VETYTFWIITTEGKPFDFTAKKILKILMPTTTRIVCHGARRPYVCAEWICGYPVWLKFKPHFMLGKIIDWLKWNDIV